MLSLGSITCAKMVSKQSKMIEKKNPISSFFQRNQRRVSQQEFWMEIDSAQRKLLKITFSSNSRTKFATSWTIHTCIIIKLVVLGIPRSPNNYPPTLEAQLFWAQATEDTDFVKRWKYQTFVENFGENWIEVGVEEREGGSRVIRPLPLSLPLIIIVIVIIIIIIIIIIMIVIIVIIIIIIIVMFVIINIIVIIVRFWGWEPLETLGGLFSVERVKFHLI